MSMRFVPDRRSVMLINQKPRLAMKMSTFPSLSAYDHNRPYNSK